MEARSAVLGSERVDIIRGKDFARWLTTHADLPNLPVHKSRTEDERVAELGSLLIRRGMLVRCERRFKKPPPGQDRLVKFPKKVVPVGGPDSQRFEPADFYAWTYDRPTSPWVYVVAAAAAVGVILVCLFPMAPAWFKIGVVYVLAGLLSVMMFVLAMRVAIAAVSYIGTGRTVWLLPNALAIEVGSDAFAGLCRRVNFAHIRPRWRWRGAEAGWLQLTHPA